MRALPLLALVWLIGCGSDGGDGAPDAAVAGRLCSTGFDAGTPTVIASPALECASGLCLHVEGSAMDMCTARCEGAADCVEGASSACTAGMMCVIPMDVGPFACQQMCVCADQVPAGGFVVTCP